MLDRLPLELLQAIYKHLRPQDLRNLALQCCSLHISALDEFLITRGVLLPTLAVFNLCPPSRRTYVDVCPTAGLCIDLRSFDNLTHLATLRLALPRFFHGRPITAIRYQFPWRAPGLDTGPLGSELKSLLGFLTRNSSAATIESLSLDLGEGWLLTSDGQPTTHTLTDILGLFCSAPGLSKCTSLTIVGGQAYSWEIRQPTYNPPRLRSGHKGSNVIQTFVSSISEKLSLSRLRRPRLESVATSGLLFVHVDSLLLFHSDIVYPTQSWFTHNLTSIRALSISEPIPQSWETLIAHITLPYLEELYLGNCRLPIPLVGDFLDRHQKLKVLDMGTSVTTHAKSLSAPPHFLPNLTTLAIRWLLLNYFLDPQLGHKALPNLQSLSLIVDIHDRNGHAMLSAFDFRMEEHTIRRLNGIPLGLKIHITRLDWLYEERPPDAIPKQGAVCKLVSFLQINLGKLPFFPAYEKTRMLFAQWLQKFPHLGSLEIWGGWWFDEEKDSTVQELAHLCKVLNPTLKTVAIDDVQLRNSGRYRYIQQDVTHGRKRS